MELTPEQFNNLGSSNANELTPEQFNALGTQIQPESKSVGGFIGNVFGSMANIVGGLADTISHPVQTAQGIINTIKHPSVIGGALKERYGSIQNIGNTLYKDPVGVGLDVATILGGVGALGKVGTEGSELAKLGETIGKAGEAINPINLGLKGAAAVVSKVGETAPGVASRVINSLIKPLSKDFAYGKNPGRTVSELGITGNSLEELGTNVAQTKQQIGKQISELYKTPTAQTTQIDLTDALNPIDEALVESRKAPRTNRALINRLENVKADLLGIPVEGEPIENLKKLEPIEVNTKVSDLKAQINTLEETLNMSPARQLAKYAGRNKEVPEVTGGLEVGKFGRFGDDIASELGYEDSESARNAYEKYLQSKNQLDQLKTELKSAKGETFKDYTPEQLNHINSLFEKASTNLSPRRELTNLTPDGAFEFKKDISDLTKWTGNLSDDKTVNKALQQSYRNISEKLKPLDESGVLPGLKKLNEQYGDLASADNAIKHRNIIANRQDLISFKNILGGEIGAAVGALTSGNAGAVIGGLGAIGLQKALGSPAFLTRLAKVLAKMSPAEKAPLFAKYPQLSKITLGTGGLIRLNKLTGQSSK